MEREFTLHYFPGSYFSLKAVLALHEKGISFKDSIVNIYNGEQHADWYRKLNPKCQVPVLQHGDQHIPDSEAIIDYIDLYCDKGPKLVPDVETTIGQDVHAMRNMLDAVPVGIITFGVLANRDNFVTSHVRMPPVMNSMLDRAGVASLIEAINSSPSYEFNPGWTRFQATSQRGLTLQHTISGPVYKACVDIGRHVNRFGGNIQRLKAAREKTSGEKRAELSTKIEGSEKFLSTIMSVESVAVELDELEKVFDKMEDQLEKSRKDSIGEGTHWLIGCSITAADITAATLMYRLSLIGIENRYFSDTKRVIVKDYFSRLCARPAMKRTIATAESVVKVLTKSVGWKVVKIGLAVGVIALGLFGLREILTARRGFRRSVA